MKLYDRKSATEVWKLKVIKRYFLFTGTLEFEVRGDIRCQSLGWWCNIGTCWYHTVWIQRRLFADPSERCKQVVLEKLPFSRGQNNRFSCLTPSLSTCHSYHMWESRSHLNAEKAVATFCSTVWKTRTREVCSVTSIWICSRGRGNMGTQLVSGFRFVDFPLKTSCDHCAKKKKKASAVFTKKIVLLLHFVAGLLAVWWWPANFCSSNGCELYEANCRQTITADTRRGL